MIYPIASPAEWERPCNHIFLQQNIWIFTLSRLNKESEKLHINLGHVLSLSMKKHLFFRTFQTSTLWIKDCEPVYEAPLLQTYLTTESPFSGGILQEQDPQTLEDTQAIGLHCNLPRLISFIWTGWISLQSKELSRVFSNNTVQKHQFFGTQLSSQSNSHMHT